MIYSWFEGFWALEVHTESAVAIEVEKHRIAHVRSCFTAEERKALDDFHGLLDSVVPEIGDMDMDEYMRSSHCWKIGSRAGQVLRQLSY